MLASLPRMRTFCLGLPYDATHIVFVAFAATCKIAQHRVELQLSKLKVTEGEAGSLAIEWMAVVRV